jgi:hypothetical protein
MKARSGNRHHSHGHARGHWALIPVALLASAAIWLLQPLRGAQIVALGAPASADVVAELFARPDWVGAAAAAAPVLDHSVVRSKQLADEPDMTGASIAAYAP